MKGSPKHQPTCCEVARIISHRSRELIEWRKPACAGKTFAKPYRRATPFVAIDDVIERAVHLSSSMHKQLFKAAWVCVFDTLSLFWGWALPIEK